MSHILVSIISIPTLFYWLICSPLPLAFHFFSTILILMMNVFLSSPFKTHRTIPHIWISMDSYLALIPTFSDDASLSLSPQDSASPKDSICSLTSLSIVTLVIYQPWPIGVLLKWFTYFLLPSENPFPLNSKYKFLK